MVIIFVLDGILRYFVSINEGIMICANEEHPSKTSFPIDLTEEGINICCNDEKLLRSKLNLPEFVIYLGEIILEFRIGMLNGHSSQNLCT